MLNSEQFVSLTRVIKENVNVNESPYTKGNFRLTRVLTYSGYLMAMIIQNKDYYEKVKEINEDFLIEDLFISIIDMTLHYYGGCIPEDIVNLSKNAKPYDPLVTVNRVGVSEIVKMEELKHYNDKHNQYVEDMIKCLVDINIVVSKAINSGKEFTTSIFDEDHDFDFNKIFKSLLMIVSMANDVNMDDYVVRIVEYKEMLNQQK